MKKQFVCSDGWFCNFVQVFDWWFYCMRGVIGI